MKPGGISSRWWVTSTRGGRAGSTGPVGEVGYELLAPADVEAGGRLVEQDDAGLGHQRARQQDPLAFARREGRQPVVGERAAAEALQQRDRPGRGRRRCTGATTARGRRSAPSSPPRPRSCSARGGRRAPATRTRCARAASARRSARAVGRARRPCRSSGAGRAPRSATASSCPRRSVRARPSARRRRLPARRRRGSGSRRGRGSTCEQRSAEITPPFLHAPPRCAIRWCAPRARTDVRSTM